MTDTISEEVCAALEARGLDTELAIRFGLHSKHHGAVGGEALVIPFLRDGKVVRRKYRTFGPDKRFSQDKGGVRCAWNEDALRDDALREQPVVITEGELDALAAVQAGFLRTISVPDGAPPPGERTAEEIEGSAKYAWLEDVRGLVGTGRVPHFVLAVDGDPNGAALLHDLSLLLGRARCKYLVYPRTRRADLGRDRLKDLGEVLEEFGERGVRECMARAQWLRVDGVHRMSELPPLPPQVLYTPAKAGLKVTAAHFRPRLGDLSVVTGVPGHGKSTWVNDVFCHLATTYGVIVGWASFEQSPQRDHRRALRSWHSGRLEKEMSHEELAAADEWIDTHHRFIVPVEDEDVTLDWFLDRAEAAAIQHGCKILVLDPWNEMDHARAPGESLTDYTGRAIKTLKRFARSLQVHVCVVAHPSKMRRNEDGKIPVPTLYDVSDSSHWYNKPDLGVVVHRANDEMTDVYVLKSRYHDIIGKPGRFSLGFNTTSRRFEELDAA